jgi:hypothetical protein
VVALAGAVEVVSAVVCWAVAEVAASVVVYWVAVAADSAVVYWVADALAAARLEAPVTSQIPRSAAAARGAVRCKTSLEHLTDEESSLHLSRSGLLRKKSKKLV